MKHAPKPTVYADTVFRSRLEASWAAFFDLAGWRWQYEPYDLKGWTPDFLIEGAHPMLVEVKPIDWSLGGKAIEDNYSALAKAIEHAKAENWGEAEYEVLLLGTAPWLLPHAREPALGLFVACLGNEYSTDPAIVYEGYDPQCLDVGAMLGWYGYRVGGQADGDHHIKTITYDEVLAIWRRARALTQWKKPIAPPQEFIPAGRAMADVVRKMKRGDA